MLVIILHNADSYTWHTYEPVPIRYEDVIHVTEVQADGDELTRILELIKGIPTNRKEVMRWFGDHARFIVGSLFTPSPGLRR